MAKINVSIEQNPGYGVLNTLSGIRIMDNTGDFYSLNSGSIPLCRTIVKCITERTVLDLRAQPAALSILVKVAAGNTLNYGSLLDRLVTETTYRCPKSHSDDEQLLAKPINSFSGDAMTDSES